jgi:monoamine oxidase
MKTYSVKLRVYRGEKSYDKSGNVTSPNQSMDLSPYLSMEWINWMKNSRNVGFTDAEVEEVREIVYTEHTKRDEKVVEPYIITTYPVVKEGDNIIDQIKEAVKKAFDNSVKLKLTPEQQELADLKIEMAEMKALLTGGTDADTGGEGGNDDTDEDAELEKWRKKFFEVTGQKAHPMSKASTLEKKIEEFLEENK